MRASAWLAAILLCAAGIPGQEVRREGSPGEATLEIYRPGRYMCSGDQVPVLVDGIQVARIQSGRYFALRVPAGAHTVRGDKTGPTRVEVVAGGEAFVRVRYDRIGWVCDTEGIGVAVMTIEEGRRDISGLKPANAKFIYDEHASLEPYTPPPPPPPPVPIAPATLRILSQPRGALVLMEDKPRGATSTDRGELLLGDLAAGSYNLRVTAPGYKDWTQAVTLSSGNTTTVDARLVAEPSQLVLVSQPGGAQVYLDDAFKGVTSEQEGRLRIENLAPGSHTLRLSLTGYKEWSQPAALGPGATLPVTAKLEPAGPKPLGLGEVVEALGTLSRARVTALVKQYGVDFALTPEAEQRLRTAGADADLLLAVAMNKK